VTPLALSLYQTGCLLRTKFELSSKSVGEKSFAIIKMNMEFLGFSLISKCNWRNHCNWSPKHCLTFKTTIEYI